MKKGSRNKHGYRRDILDFGINVFGKIQRDHITEWRVMSTKFYSYLLMAIFYISVLSSSAEGVETAEYCDTLSFNASSPEGNYTLLLFDPSLGNLLDVNLAVDLEVMQDFSLENERSNGQTIDAESEAVLNVTLPDLSSISVNASSSVSEKLEAYDGTADFEGPSGKTIEGAASRGSFEQKYTEPSDFVASTQNETISLPAVLEVSSSARGNIALSIATVAESKICVTYTYEPGNSAAQEKGESK